MVFSPTWLIHFWNTLGWAFESSIILPCAYVNSNSSYLKKAHFHLYADDIKIYCKIDTHSDCQILSNVFNQFNVYISNLGISLNVNECSVIPFSRSRKLLLFPYVLNNSKLQRGSIIKALGIYYSSFLSFNHYTDLITDRSLNSKGFKFY